MSENIYKFQKLTPVSNAELTVYEDAMDYIFSNEDIRNIAISGAYGAGKSSIIETYKEQFKDAKFLHISLAHFTNNNSEKEGRINNNEESDKKMNDDDALSIENVLEGKILNQLIHQIKAENIPQTKFSTKKNINGKLLAFRTAEIVLFLFLSLFIKFHDKWISIENGMSISHLKDFFEFTTTYEMLIVSSIIWLVLLSRGLYVLLYNQVSKNIFKRINVKGNELEIFEDTNDSYFDKYLNEVLYLFEHADSTNIVFEDMDRYDTNLIFEKLREINTLLNRRKELFHSSKKDVKKEYIRFFYLLRDDIFLSKDRTKFFDYILPIVPIVDASNAYDKFIEHFKEGGILQLFDEKFMQGLSLYVDDMRLLKNIYNEFVIYYNRLKTSATEQNPNKLLAIITYKNIFPRDFAELQLSQGYVYTLFSKKEEFRNNEVLRIQSLINDYEEEIDELKNEVSSDLNELDSIFLVLGQNGFNVNGVNESSYTKRSELIAAIKQYDYVIQTYYPYNRSWNDTNVRDKFDKLSQNKEYIERKLKIENKANGKIEINNSKIAELTKEIALIGNRHLKEIINRENEKSIFQISYINELGEENNFEEIKRSPYFRLIKFLLKNGFIDETYPDYMTYFYANSITKIDKVFLFSITDNEAKEYQYELVNPELVISRMRDTDFKAPESLNFSLLDFLIKNSKTYSEQLNIFLSRIRDEKPSDFTLGYLQRDIQRISFTQEFNNVWDYACYWIVKTDDFPTEIKKLYVIDTLCISSNEIILKNNLEDLLTQFISNDAKFLEIANPDIDHLISGFLDLEVRFKQIDYISANRELFDKVYQNDLYDINLSMIDLILEKIYKIEKSDDYNNRNMSLIMTKPEEPLYQYIINNIDCYMDVLLKRNMLIDDDETTAIYLINNINIDEAKLYEYIRLLQTPIQYLERIENCDMWSKLIFDKKIEYNHKNIFDYYFRSGKGMDNALLFYINNYPEQLSVNGIDLDATYGEKSKSQLFNSVVKSNEMDSDKYVGLVKSFNLIYTGFSHTDVNDEKVSLLFNHHIITMTVVNLEFMRTHHTTLLLEFIKANIDKYTELITDEVFSSEELLKLLSSEIDDKYKATLLGFESSPISIKKCNYSERIITLILKNNLDENDVTYLLTWYPSSMSKVQDEIEKIAERKMEEIIDEEYQLNLNLLAKVLMFKTVTESDKKLLLANNLSGKQIDDAKNLLSIGGLDEFLPIFDGKRPKYEKTAENKRLLDIFEKNRWVRYEEDKENSEYYRAYGRRYSREKEMPVQLL